MSRSAGLPSRSPALRFYVHVPYCARRCGYCDFNTYVPGDEGRGSQADWCRSVTQEVRRARLHAPADHRPVSSIFVGGGTPTLLPVADLATVITTIADEFGLTRDAEITVEANPENVTPGLLDDLLAAGVTRLSLGMQSADPQVLAVLGRRHRPGGAIRAARLAELAGFQAVSVDLIYGTPGETLTSWRRTLAATVATGITHVSAYALKVEAGTELARRVAAGQLPTTDDDFAASCYEIADEVLTSAGLAWYEISNWAVPGHECQHNLGYWVGDDWWGVGPGAHSHRAGQRFWNLRHPTRWSQAIATGSSVVAGSETLTAQAARLERIMLAVRLAVGFDPVETVGARGPAVAATLAERGLLERCPAGWRLTRRGRLLGDAVTLELAEAAS